MKAVNVRDILNEIKKGVNNPLTSIGIGAITRLRDWVDWKIKRKFIPDVTAKVDDSARVHARYIILYPSDIRKVTVYNLQKVGILECRLCEIKDGRLVKTHKELDHIRGREYLNHNGEFLLHKLIYVDNYLYYLSLKLVRDAGDKGITPTELSFFIRKLQYPNSDPHTENLNVWNSALYASSGTVLSTGVTQVGKAKFKINDVGLGLIDKFDKIFV